MPETTFSSLALDFPCPFPAPGVPSGLGTWVSALERVRENWGEH